jgi:enoyl-CoA hydratase/carnithine racemase
MVNENVRIEHEGGVALLYLSRGITNALNLELVTGLSQAIEDVKLDADICGLVLTSANDKFFSIGFDIPQLFDLSPDDFASFYRAFNRLCLDLYTLPKPTAAAITGHATAGGCILALCCDYRTIAQGRKLIGLNEIMLGVPVPYVADCILRQLVGQRLARDVIDSGAFHDPEEALRLGLVDQALPLSEVIPAAIEKVRGLGSSPGEAFAEIKRYRTEPVLQQVEPRLEETDRAFIGYWYGQAARERLKEAMSRF